MTVTLDIETGAVCRPAPLQDAITILSDDSGHHYLVPESQFKVFCRWVDDGDGGPCPDRVVRLNGPINQVRIFSYALEA